MGRDRGNPARTPGRSGPAVHVSPRQPDPGEADLAGSHRGERAGLLGAEDDRRVGGRGTPMGRACPGRASMWRSRSPRWGRRRCRNRRPGRCQRRTRSLRAGLSGDQQEPQPGQVLLEGRQQRWDAAHRRDPFFLEVLLRGPRPAGRRVRLWRQRRPGDPGGPDLFHRKIKGDRHPLVHAVRAAQRRTRPPPPGQNCRCWPGPPPRPWAGPWTRRCR